MGRHLATFTHRPGSSLYTLTTESPPVNASGQVAASGQVFAAASRSSPASAPCSCRPLSHETLLWHHRLGHPSLPRLQGMASRTLVSGLPRSLPPLPPGPAPTCVSNVEGWQRAAPPSSEFPPPEAPLQTLHMDVWGPACVHGQGHERYFLLVVDDYSCYTTVFPLCRKGEVTEGICQTFMLPASPQQNGIAERRIGMVMDVARTSMIHAAAPHFLWPFAVQYAAHQINLQPRVSLPETTPTLLAGDGWRCVCVPCLGISSFCPRYFRGQAVLPCHSVEPVEVAVDSGAARGAEPGGAERGVAESEGAEPGGAEPESVEPGGAEPGGVERLCEWYARRFSRVAGDTGPAAGGASGVGAAGGGAGAGAAGGAGRGGAGAGGTGAVGGPTGVGAARGTGAAGPGGARTGDTGAAGASGAAGVGAVGAGAIATGGAAGAGAAGGIGAGGAAGVVAGDPGAEGTGAVSVVSGGAARPWLYYVPLLQQVLGLPPSTGPTPPLLSPPPVQSQLHIQPASPLPGPSPYSGPNRGLTERREPESRPASPESRPASPESRLESPVRARVPLPSPPASSLLDGLDPESDSLRAASPTVMRFLATVVIDPLFESTAASALVAELVDFAAACRLDFATSLVAESASESVTPPSIGGECALSTDVLEDRQEEFEFFAAAVPHLVSMPLALEGDPDAPDIPTPCSYVEAIEGPYSSQWKTAMDTEMASWKSTGTYVDEVPPPGANIVSGMWIFRVKRSSGSPSVFKARYVAQGFSQRQGVDFFQTFYPTPKMTTLWVLLHVAAQRDYELHSLDFSTAFLQGSLHEEIWLRRSLGFTGSFPPGTQWSLRRPVYGLRQAPCEWHDRLRTTLAALGFAPSTADPSLFLRTDTILPPFYVLVYVYDLVFATADTEALAHVKSELRKRHTCTDLAPPSDESVEPNGPYPELVGCLVYLMTCTRPDFAYPLNILARYFAPGRHKKEHMDATKRVLRYLCSTSGMGLVLGGRARVVLTGHADASWADDLTTQRSSQGYTFSLGSGSVSWQSTRSSSVLSSSCEAEIYAEAMAAQELRWLTYLLTDLGEPPRSPPVLYVNNKAMIAFCQEHRLEHRTKHIALRYFLSREFQQRDQLRLAYVATLANTADFSPRHFSLVIISVFVLF
ncbi:unnamed protein product [Closterium sp. NIES-54]